MLVRLQKQWKVIRAIDSRLKISPCAVNNKARQWGNRRIRLSGELKDTGYGPLASKHLIKGNAELYKVPDHQGYTEVRQTQGKKFFARRGPKATPHMRMVSEENVSQTIEPLWLNTERRLVVDEDREKGTKEIMKLRGIIGFIVSESLLFQCYWIIGSINKVNGRLD